MASPLLRPSTNDEVAKVAEFRGSDQFAAMADEFHDSTVMQEAHTDDRLIIRFLRARNQDVPETLKMFHDMLTWRREFGADQASSWTFPQVDRVKEHYPHGFHKFAKSGLPVYVARIGLLNPVDLLGVYDVPDLVRLHVRLREYFRTVLSARASQRAGTQIDQQISILDANGISLSQISRKVYQFIQETSFIDQNYYPEILSRLFIVNAPFYFSAVWKVVKPWIEERVQKKMLIIRSSNVETFLELIDAESLPDFLGGSDGSFLTTTEEIEFRQLVRDPAPNDSSRAVVISHVSETGS